MKSTSFAFLALLALPFFAALDDSSVWDSNEAYYVQTPREMIERGDWLVPYFNGQPRINKPPLSYWIVAACYRLFSDSLFWERFPMAVLAYGCVWALFWMGRILFTEPVGLLGAGILATTFRFLLLSRRLFIDILLLFCLLMAVAFFLSWLKKEKKRDFLLSALFFGFAFLTKGPIALLPVLFLALYLLLSGRRDSLARAPWIGGSVLFLLVVSPWFFVLGLQAGWDGVIDFFLQENLGRYTHLKMGPERGPFYYLGVFIGDFFPWSIFFGAALIGWLRKGRIRSDPVLLLACWILTYFLFFSLAYNKQENYLLPVYPAAAMWVALYWEKTRPSYGLRAGISGLILILGIGLYLTAHQLFYDIRMAWVPPILLVAAAVFSFRAGFRGMIASLALFYFAAFALYLKPFERYKPVPYFARSLQSREAQTGRTWKAGYYRFAAPSLAYYLNRPILELHRPDQALAQLQSDQPVYLIVREREYKELAKASPGRVQIVEVRPRLYTTLRTVIEGFRSGGIDAIEGRPENVWTQPIYLITNRSGGSVRSAPGLQ